MRMRVGQSSLDGGLDPDWFGRDERLERIRDAVDWEGVAGLLSGVHDACEGRPAFPPVVMARVLLLKHWLGASDEHMSRRLRTRTCRTCASRVSTRIVRVRARRRSGASTRCSPSAVWRRRCSTRSTVSWRTGAWF